jgi:phosphate transport system ATP-binding protein
MGHENGDLRARNLMGMTANAESALAAVNVMENGSVSMRVENLTVGFGAAAVLREVSLPFPNGSITALVGPTGSGKSTFLRTLNRMNDRVRGFFRQGDVLVGGRSLWAPGTDVLSLRRQIGMLFQRPNPFPMSIADNVCSGVRAHGSVSRRESREIAERQLRQVGLWDAVADRLGDSPFRLSGGQQQLLCLARALAVQPRILLLDEPTSSLDPVSTQKIEDLIRGLTPELTVVVVTHNLPQASRLSDSIAFFYQGRLVEHGATKQVMQKPREKQTENYISGRFD